ncbi:MAG: hypothetical protein PHF86_01025 [Candidatus Nanoarchaeia archaeon]|nr:hypothetical protein [Candidatus Nanoarchaeia archaeon]
MIFISQKVENIRKVLLKETWIESLLTDGNVYLVGGCIRDSYRNKTIKDIDIVVEELPISSIKKILSHYGEFKEVGDSFAVIKFRPFNHIGEDFDIAIPRIDRKIGEGHKGFSIETKGVTILDDLKRRDFTINSIAVNVKTGEILDPFNGTSDIEKKIIKATDSTAFIEDPLRILRGIQFAARFNYLIEKDTLKLMKDNAHLIMSISGERILDEFMKVVHKNGNNKIVFDLLQETNVDLALFNNKISTYDGIYYLDEVSFFYTLGILGGISPSDFIKNRLKGERLLEKDLQTMEKIFKLFPTINNQEDLRLFLSKSFTVSPRIMQSKIFPSEIENIIKLMLKNKIPTTLKDLNIDGNDILILSNNEIKDKALGEVLEKIMRGALMNDFNWKDRLDSLNYLGNVISKIN